MKVEVVTPEKTVFQGEARQVTLTTSQGEITVLPKHVNLITMLVPGELRIQGETGELVFATGFGFANISSQKVIVSTDLANTPEEIEEAKVIEAKKRAEEVLKERLTEEEFATTLASLERALAQLKVKRRRSPKVV